MIGFQSASWPPPARRTGNLAGRLTGQRRGQTIVKAVDPSNLPNSHLRSSTRNCTLLRRVKVFPMKLNLRAGLSLSCGTRLGLCRALLAATWAAPGLAEDAAAVERRLTDTVKYLASDELEGRGVGTQGLDRAADYVAEQFKELGLKTDVIDGGPFQKFKMTTGASLGADNSLTLVAPAQGGKEPHKVDLKLGEQFNPLAIGGSEKFDLPLVFVGYGITAKDEKYDDYAGVDVKGKAVIILRHEPQQANPHSAFDGTKHLAACALQAKGLQRLRARRGGGDFLQ